MEGARRILRGAKVTLVAAAIAGYAIASHRMSTAPAHAGFGTALLALAPLLAAIVFLAWRAQRVAAAALATGGIALLWLASPLIAAHLPATYLLQGVGADAALMLVFGASLRPGHEPLCARFARMIRGAPLPPAVARYTWQATLAWTIFFAAMIVASVGLFFAAPVEVWSIFANLLPLPLIGAMIVGEYVVRRRVMREQTDAPLSDTIRAWWANRHVGGGRGPARPRLR